MGKDTIKTHDKPQRRYDWLKQYQFQKGNNANPNGRPKGKSLKTFVREMFEAMDDENKAIYLKQIDPDFAWKMGEGNPDNKTDITTKGDKISITPEVLKVATEYEKKLNDLEDEK